MHRLTSAGHMSMTSAMSLLTKIDDEHVKDKVPHLLDLTEWVRLIEARRPLSAMLRLPIPRSSADFSSRELKPVFSRDGA